MEPHWECRCTAPTPAQQPGDGDGQRCQWDTPWVAGYWPLLAVKRIWLTAVISILPRIVLGMVMFQLDYCAASSQQRFFITILTLRMFPFCLCMAILLWPAHITPIGLVIHRTCETSNLWYRLHRTRVTSEICYRKHRTRVTSDLWYVGLAWWTLTHFKKVSKLFGIGVCDRSVILPWGEMGKVGGFLR